MAHPDECTVTATKIKRKYIDKIYNYYQERTGLTREETLAVSSLPAPHEKTG